MTMPRALRGLVITLTAAQIVERAQRMANHPGKPWFNPNWPPAPEGYYRLKFPNGGTNPLGPDNFAHWRYTDPKRTGFNFVDPTDPKFHFVTGDCVSLDAWAGGWDRLQTLRAAHIQGGAINTDLQVEDANGPAKCFERLKCPEPGCFVVYSSLTDQDDDGVRDGAGHTGVVVGYYADGSNGREIKWNQAIPEWDEKEKQCWLDLAIIDCASRSPHLAVQLTNARAWFGSRTGEAGITVPKNSIFCRSIMKP